MAPPTQSQASSSQAKGFATIALASAAGVLVASRMNRPALMLAAGLALSWWRQHSSAGSRQEAADLPPADGSMTPNSADESVTVAKKIDSESAPEQIKIPVLETALDSSFPSVPERTDSSLVSAWDDLRAAIAPEAENWIKATEPERPLPEIMESSDLDVVKDASPAMPHFFVSLPSSPWIGAEEPEETVPEAEVHFIPRSADLSGQVNSGFILPNSDPSQAPTEPLTRTEALIEPDDKLQSKKSFFDWLRS